MSKKHCDDYIHDQKAPLALRWFIFINRLPAMTRALADQAGVEPTLFADYHGKTVRVVMASRFGDVGITTHLDVAQGYDTRVFLEDLANFREKP
jgi:hypothetical protein